MLLDKGPSARARQVGPTTKILGERCQVALCNAGIFVQRGGLVGIAAGRVA